MTHIGYVVCYGPYGPWVHTLQILNPIRPDYSETPIIHLSILPTYLYWTRLLEKDIVVLPYFNCFFLASYRGISVYVLRLHTRPKNVWF